MPFAETVILGALALALVLYFLFGGADFGGGVWDLLARGPRKQAQRELIAHAIGPVWEANHVWLIFAVVILFSAFPKAFWGISIALHVPLTLFLVGVVFRGSAFAFRSANYNDDTQQRLWGRVFAFASIAAPLLLGITVGAIASGRIHVDTATNLVTSGFFDPWLQPFPFAVGAFALAQCAFLAATWLTNETEDAQLKDDFRRKALIAGVIVGLLAALAIALAHDGAPRIFEGLTHRRWTWPFHATTALIAVAALASLYTRRYRHARVLAAAQIALVLIGWGFSQYPYALVPDVTLQQAAENATTHEALAWAILGGAPILGPSLYMLLRIFKAPGAKSAVG